jgi:hypothetical protein
MKKVDPWENVSWRNAGWRVSLDRIDDRASVLTIEKLEEWGGSITGSIKSEDLVIGLGELRKGSKEVAPMVQVFARLPVDAQSTVVNAISEQLSRALEWDSLKP